MTYEWIKVKSDEQLKECVVCINSAFKQTAVKFELNITNAPHNGAFLDFGKLKSEMIKGTKMYGLSVNGTTLIGCIGFKSKKDGTAELVRFSVREEYQKQGYGNKLLAYLEKEVSDQGFFEISLGCIAEDCELIRFYGKAGFTLKSTKSFRKLPHKVSFMTKRVKT